MPDHAGFAGAVTIRENVLNIALLSAYANGSFPTVLAGSIPGGPPSVTANLFLGQPGINCEGATNLLVLTMPARGELKVTRDEVEHAVQIAADLVVTFRPVFSMTNPSDDEELPQVKLSPGGDEINVRSWSASVLTTETPAEIVSYLTGNDFKTRLENALRAAIAFQQFNLPTIDVSFFSELTKKVSSVEARVRNGVLLLGMNTAGEGPIVGNLNELIDFAGSHDVAGIVNPAATEHMLDELYTKMNDQITAAGASLHGFEAIPRAGYFQVSGAASKSSGTVNFSFRFIPDMFYTRPGKYFQYLSKPRRVYSRTWAALKFRIEGVDTDVDRPWWVILFGEVILGILTGGAAIAFIELLYFAAAQNFSGKVKRANTGPAAARIRRTIGPQGGVDVRIALDEFNVTVDGTYTGVSIQETSKNMALLGPKKIPVNFSDEPLRYIVRLPSGVLAADPALRIQWILENRDNNVVLTELDGKADVRLRFQFTPSSFSGVINFGIRARLYRRLGNNETELGTTSLRLQIREALPPGTYVRWLSEVKNPQMKVSEATDEWTYQGEVQVRRWSEWHRTDSPCLAVNAQNRYRYNLETVDKLPFPLRLLENHRKGLCPYCFYGGPAGVNPEL